MDTPFPKGRNREEEGVTGPEQVPNLKAYEERPSVAQCLSSGPPWGGSAPPQLCRVQRSPRFSGVGVVCLRLSPGSAHPGVALAGALHPLQGVGLCLGHEPEAPGGSILPN